MAGVTVVGVREFRQDLKKYLRSESAVVVVEKGLDVAIVLPVVVRCNSEVGELEVDGKRPSAMLEGALKDAAAANRCGWRGERYMPRAWGTRDLACVRAGIGR